MFLYPSRWQSGARTVHRHCLPGRGSQLEWVNGELANVWITPMIARIDPASGPGDRLIDLTALAIRRSQQDASSTASPIRGALSAVVTGNNWDGSTDRRWRQAAVLRTERVQLVVVMPAEAENHWENTAPKDLFRPLRIQELHSVSVGAGEWRHAKIRYSAG